MKFDLKYLEKLAKLMDEHELTEMSLEDQEQSIVFKREKETVTAQQIAPVTQLPQIIQQPQVAKATSEQQKEEEKTKKAIKSPMVGTFYMASSPGAKPCVEVGSTVSTGQVVCIIEAMKLMNEIEAEVSGKVTQICVKDGEAVEYGQVLMYVE